MSGCKARLDGQDETYECGRPVLHSSSRCDRHIDYAITSFEIEAQALRDSIARDTAALSRIDLELAGLRRAVAERDSPNS